MSNSAKVQRIRDALRIISANGDSPCQTQLLTPHLATQGYLRAYTARIATVAVYAPQCRCTPCPVLHTQPTL